MCGPQSTGSWPAVLSQSTRWFLSSRPAWSEPRYTRMVLSVTRAFPGGSPGCRPGKTRTPPRNLKETSSNDLDSKVHEPVLLRFTGPTRTPLVRGPLPGAKEFPHDWSPGRPQEPSSDDDRHRWCD